MLLKERTKKMASKLKVEGTRSFINTNPSFELVSEMLPSPTSARNVNVLVRHIPSNKVRSLRPEVQVSELVDAFIDGSSESKMVRN